MSAVSNVDPGAAAVPGFAGDDYEVVIVGGGPAGLSAGLNLVRQRRRVLILDSNRPRHSATLVSHGFLTRDGASPLELRGLGREEFAGYPTAEFHQGLVMSIAPRDDKGWFAVSSRGVRGSSDRTVRTRTLLLASGLAETLPALPSIRAFYGTALHSCTECDAFEKGDAPLALLGDTADLYERAVLVSQVTDDLVVFTLGSEAVTEEQERDLAARGARVERGEVADVVGDRTGMTGVVLADGAVVARTGGFVRPHWSAPLEFADALGLAREANGFVVVDEVGRTTVPGVWAAGDITPPGPQQLIVAAGAGARAAAALNRALLSL